MSKKTAILFLHGSGGDGDEMREVLDAFPIPSQGYNTFRQLANTLNMDIYTPTARARRYSAAGGERMHVWFDRSPLFLREALDSAEDSQGAAQSILALVDTLLQLDERYHYEHYFLGGFSMGGGCALHFLRDGLLPAQLSRKLRGVFTMGSFLVSQSAVLTAPLLSSSQDISVLCMHGESDSMIRCDWGSKTTAALLMRGLDVHFRSYAHVDHEIDPNELSDLFDWMKSTLAKYQDPLQEQKEREQRLESKYDSVSEDMSGKADLSSSVPSSSSQKASTTADSANSVAALPYTLENVSSSGGGREGESKLCMVAPKVIVRFDVPAEYVPLLIARPILACGSMFEVQQDLPRGVMVELHSSDPHKTAQEIGKRLFNRIHSGSSSLNPCQPS